MSLSSIQEVIGAYKVLDENHFIVFLYAKWGFTSNLVLVTDQLLQLYAKFGDVESAKNVFDHLNWKDTVAWSVHDLILYGVFSITRDAICSCLQNRPQKEYCGWAVQRLTEILPFDRCAWIRHLQRRDDRWIGRAMRDVGGSICSFNTVFSLLINTKQSLCFST